MLQQIWTSPSRMNIVCVDSYDEGVMKGRFYSHEGTGECFSSLSQFLLKMEEQLDQTKLPQAYTSPRTFSMFLEQDYEEPPMPAVRKGQRATFELKVIFRQHSSWQGVILWREGKQEFSFRSVLELIFLMDSALRCLEVKEAG